jgi:hypothetical protein
MPQIKEKMAHERLGKRQIHNHCQYDQLERCDRLSMPFISAMELRETSGTRH